MKEWFGFIAILVLLAIACVFGGSFIVRAFAHEIKVEKSSELEVWTNHYQNYEPVSAAHYVVKIVGRDPSTDVALLQVIDTGYVPAMAASFVPPSYAVHRGQTIYVVGNPGIEFDASVTKGIVSNTQRTVDFGTGPQHFFQTDAAAIGGNSGGSVYNDDGLMVGTLTGGINGSTITFVVPISSAHDLIKANGFDIDPPKPAFPEDTGSVYFPQPVAAPAPIPPGYSP